MNFPFSKITYIDLPPLPFWNSFTELSEVLSPRLQTSFCPQIKPNLQLSHCASFSVNIPKPTILVVYFSSVQSSPTLWDPMDCTPVFPVHHQLPVLAQIHVLRVSDAIQPSHPLLSPSLPGFNLAQHQGLFQWVTSSHQVAKVLELQLQHQSFQWIFRTDFF